METNVVRIFFQDNFIGPSYELSDGRIKEPFRVDGELVWITKEEFKEYHPIHHEMLINGEKIRAK